MVTLAVGLALLTPASALAKQKPITGSLSKGGYTVIALDYGGHAALAAGPKFKLVASAKTFTLQLRDKSGNYAGPIVAPTGKRTVVITGFRAGAKLGRIAVKKGYAVTKTLAKSAVDAKRTAVAKGGRPIGAGKLGEVKAASKGAVGLGLDPDRDGLPGAFDVDDDGDMRLDNVDTTPPHAAIVFGDLYHAMWLMNIGLEQSFIAARTGLAPGASGYALNKNTRNQWTTSDAFMGLVNTAMKLRGSLLIPLPGLQSELDCTGLSYCTPFGKSTAMDQMKRFPGDFDADGNGMGLMTPVGSFNPANDGIGTIQFLDPTKVFGMKPGADRTQIQSGQTLIERPTGGGQPVAIMLNEVFQTVPALAAWADESGANSLAQHTINYPVSVSGPGSQTNPIELRPSTADGDYWLKLHLWRPQRFDEAYGGNWVDLGWLTYSVVGRTIGPNSRLWKCPLNAYRPSPADDGIDPMDMFVTSGGAPGVFDLSQDGVWSANHTFTFEINLSACQRASGIPVWNNGDQTALEVSVAAITQWGDAAEGVGFAFRPEQPPGGGGGGGGGGGPAPQPATGTWSFPGGTPGTDVNWSVHMNDANVTKLRIQFHQSTPITGHTDPSGWTCTTTAVSNPNDTLECTHPTGEAAGTTITGALTLTSPGANGMPVQLFATENGTETEVPMSQQ